MPSLLHLPTELIIEVLEHLQPVTELPHPLQSFNPNEWDIRHWGRTLAAVARACQLLHDIAIPLLYSRYEARFQIPIHDFIDRVIEDNTLGPRSIITRNEGPYCAKYKPTAERRSMYRAWGKISSHLKPYGIRNRRQLTTDECAQPEVWMLVRQAPNLEVLSVQNSWSGNFACALPPVWLLPVMDAATLLFFEVDNNTGWYEHLHTLEVNMNQKCGTYLAFLFALPRLRRLSISSVRWQPADDGIAIEDNIWPDSHPTSKVHVLELEDMDVDADFIVRMIDCCQTLTSFKCDRNTDGIFDSSRPWCEEILGSLQRHGKTLKELTLDPLDQHLGVHPDFEYARFECIRSFERLEFLEVPSMILLGRPASTTVNGLWSWTDYQPAPATRDIIPPNLQTLVLHMGPAYSPGTQGFEDFFIGGLPPKTDSTGAGLSNGLKAVQVDYMRLPHNASLPMNFWDIQHAYEQAGSAFEYSVILDIDDNFNPDVSLDTETAILAQTLSTYGSKGVQMACHFPAADITLPRQVMDILGLGKDWLETKEAKEVLLGEKVNYNAVETKWESLEEARRLRTEAANRNFEDFLDEDTPDEDTLDEDTPDDDDDEDDDDDGW